ncbi:hypothetical protein ACFPM0_21575 [Pseudonocardia sulfidoxydans]|uniref:hypothetical protein n=1 Tax=Pseudonocardia sulfidoxydans TaxID=54011 RepID=UPI003615F9DF
MVRPDALAAAGEEPQRRHRPVRTALRRLLDSDQVTAAPAVGATLAFMVAPAGR